MKQRRSLLFGLAVVAIVGAVWFFVFLIAPRTETLDQRVHDVASQLKCLVCQGESVADSPALLSQQMREVIRQQLQGGKSEQEVIQYFVDRYGDRILLSPPWQGFSLLAWLVPIIMLLGGVLLLFFVLRDWHGLSRSNALGNDATNIDEGELERYRAELEQELATEDPLFARPGTEAG